VTFAQSGFAPPFPQWLHFLSEGPSSFHFRSHSSTVSGQLRYFPARCGTIYVPGQWQANHPPPTSNDNTKINSIAKGGRCESKMQIRFLFHAIILGHCFCCRSSLPRVLRDIKQKATGNFMVLRNDYWDILWKIFINVCWFQIIHCGVLTQVVYKY